ncbi:hypothetical protein [Sorangium sp. So ce362]|uniref:hypothetical protein n=1 Tax=Sorangium sp. So ce362 TaxID=3133303 RepID=UPI003F644E99
MAKLMKFHDELASGLRYPMSDRLRGGQLKAAAASPGTPTKRPPGGRSDDRDPPMHQDSHRKDGKGLDRYRRDGTRPGDRPPGAPPSPSSTPTKPAAAASLEAVRAENTRLRAEIARREKASKAPPAHRGPALLTGREREELDRAMGITPTRATGPGLDELGRFVVGVETPTQTRARLARAGKAA